MIIYNISDDIKPEQYKVRSSWHEMKSRSGCHDVRSRLSGSS